MQAAAKRFFSDPVNELRSACRIKRTSSSGETVNVAASSCDLRNRNDALCRVAFEPGPFHAVVIAARGSRRRSAFVRLDGCRHIGRSVPSSGPPRAVASQRKYKNTRARFCDRAPPPDTQRRWCGAQCCLISPHHHRIKM